VNRRSPPLPPYRNAPPGSAAAQPPVPPQPPPPTILNPPQSPTAAQLLVGTPQDNVWPTRLDPGTPPLDARTAALQSFATYITNLVFTRVGATGGNPVFFSIPRENFWLDQPGPEEDLYFPSIGVLSGPGEVKHRGGIGPCVIADNTADLFGPGTALILLGELEETIGLEVWTSNLFELYAVVATIEQALNATQERHGILLLTPDYYQQTARFILEKTEWPEDMAPQNRRKAVLSVFMAIDKVRLVNYTRSLPLGQIDSETPATQTDSRVTYLDPSVGSNPYPSGPNSGSSI
jgi:hypothetical protein